MFGFTRLEMESTGSAERFPIRIENLRRKKSFFLYYNTTFGGLYITV